MRADIREELGKRVLVLDGAMGTMIQHVTPDVRSNDELVLTNPDVILDIHRQYIDAGADIIETDTFNANAISLAEHGLSDAAYEINLQAARLARQAAGDDRWVAGSIGPTNVSLSIADGSATFDLLESAYFTQAQGLIDGGADTLLIETVFDPLNAKAAISGAMRAMADRRREVPIMISATLNESGRLLTGQSLEAFVVAVSHAKPLSIGLNCGFGVEQLLPYIEQLQDADCFVSLHANAGLPDALGRYTQSPEHMSFTLRRLFDRGMLNIAGGCCGTTPQHIREIARLAAQATPRRPKADAGVFTLSGLEVMQRSDFLKVGERCNVAGSRNFLKLIQQGEQSKALDIAAKQIADGAALLDINMDDGMLDAAAEMTCFVKALTIDARTAAVPLMIDSSDFSVIEQALKLIPGRPIVNSISLKEGEEIFLQRARTIRRLGAAVMVMAFDEEGQATTRDRRIEICTRAYNLLTRRVGFRGCEIVFDPNVLTIATGIPEHDNYAVDFIEATRTIVNTLPGAVVSGGISNLSFSFRGKNDLRKAMHALFISRARKAGLAMAIVNPAAPVEPTDDMPQPLLEAIDDVVMNRRADATDRLLQIAAATEPAPKPKGTTAGAPAPEAAKPHTVTDAILHVDEPALMALIERKVADGMSALDIINGPLMDAMNHIGELFGAGKLFLPQVVNSASLLRKSIDRLTPLISSTDSAESFRPKMVLATVKGDVHDIGKNIVATVMRCSGFDVIDLGVMVPAEKIIDEAVRCNAALIGLSGLITPSLNEMCEVARRLEERGLKIPLFVGGATTSDMHTAVKIAPLYSGLVVRTADAAALPHAATNITELEPEIRRKQNLLQQEFNAKTACIPLEQARQHSEAVDAPAASPRKTGRFDYSLTVDDLAPLINWRAFLGEWSIVPDFDDPEVQKILEQGRRFLASMTPEIRARVILAPARRSAPEEISVGDIAIATPRATVPNPVTGRTPALADYVAPSDDHIALFAVSACSPANPDDQYADMMQQILCHRLAEAATAWLHATVRADLWGIADDCGIRPAVGYPSLPDHSLIFTLDKMLRLNELGISLTESGAMNPDASTCGIIIGHPASRYFSATG